MIKSIHFVGILFIILLMLGCNKSRGYEDFVKKHCGYIYAPCNIIIDNFDALPEIVKNNSFAEILKLINSEEMESNIKFIDCQVLEACEEIKNYDWALPIYRLNYEWVMGNNVLKFYCFTVEMNSKGELLEKIDLPDIKANEDNRNFISTSEFDRILKEQEFQYFDDLSVEFDTLNQKVFIQLSVWDYKDNSCLITVKESLIINAHNGETNKK